MDESLYSTEVDMECDDYSMSDCIEAWNVRKGNQIRDCECVCQEYI